MTTQVHYRHAHAVAEIMPIIKANLEGGSHVLCVSAEAVTELQTLFPDHAAQIYEAPKGEESTFEVRSAGDE